MAIVCWEGAKTTSLASLLALMVELVCKVGWHEGENVGLVGEDC